MTRDLMRHGASAAIFGRKADKLKASAEWLEKDANNGTKCIITPGDVRKPEDLKAAVAETVKQFGRIDFVICGAAGNFLAPIDGLSENAFRTVIEIDLLGTFNTFKATIGEVRKAHGSYVHVSATLHYNGLPWQSAASAAKAGIDALSQVIAAEYGPWGVRSNIIAPGFTDGTEGADRLMPKGGEEYIDMRIPMQRKGEKGDIGNMSVFLFSDAASYITGCKFVVDGGAWHNGGFCESSLSGCFSPVPSVLFKKGSDNLILLIYRASLPRLFAGPQGNQGTCQRIQVVIVFACTLFTIFPQLVAALAMQTSSQRTTERGLRKGPDKRVRRRTRIIATRLWGGGADVAWGIWCGVNGVAEGSGARAIKVFISRDGEEE